MKNILNIKKVQIKLMIYEIYQKKFNTIFKLKILLNYLN